MIFEVMFPETKDCADTRIAENIHKKLSHPYQSKTVSGIIVISTVILFAVLFGIFYFLSLRRK
jgi:uncharacterized membrane protein